MKKYLFLASTYFYLACGTGAGTVVINDAQLLDAGLGTVAPLDSLTAYRKAPVAPKTVAVKG